MQVVVMKSSLNVKIENFVRYFMETSLQGVIRIVSTNTNQCRPDCGTQVSQKTLAHRYIHRSHGYCDKLPGDKCWHSGDTR